MALKKVFQDKDNCLDACIATLLKIPLKDVPETRWLHEDAKQDGWFKAINSWLIKKHKSRLILAYGDKAILTNIHGGYDKPFILVIKGSYAKLSHAVIIDKTLKIIHDPAHPSCVKKSFTEIYGLNVQAEYALFLTKD